MSKRWNWLRGRTSARLTLANQVTTTTLGSGATTSYVVYTAVAVGNYSTGSIQGSVVANASGSPSLTLQESCDGGTTYTSLTTSIIADMTTTANTGIQRINNFGDLIRVRTVPSTTTSSARYTVKGVFKV